MADLNGGHGKFQGIDENVNYAASFVGATKVAEKVKKGGTETKSDGYVVDAIDIDWGGLKLTTIAEWRNGLQTVSSTEQNAGKGDNTAGIHSTAYLLNLISSSFTQIYNEIGGNDNAGLRKKIADLATSIGQIADSTPGQLAELRENIKKINDELADPGAAGTMVTILDALDGFNKDNKGDVKEYIDVHDQAILGTATDSATTYSVYGVRKYVDTTAKENLIGKKGDKWSAQTTLYGVVEYVDTTAKDRLIGTSTDTTIDTHYGLKHILIGNTADTTINTHWGVKNSLIGTASDNKDSNTIKGAKKYADYVQNTLIGKSTDTTINTHWGVKNSLLGKDGDEWPTKQTLYGVAKYTDEAKASVIGTSYDTITADTIYGVRKLVDATFDDIHNQLTGSYNNSSISNTIWGAKNYAVEKDGELAESLIGKSTDQSSADTIWGAKNYAEEQVFEFAESLIGTSYDTAINTHWGIINSLIGKSDDASTADTIWGAKNYAQTQNTELRSELLGNIYSGTNDKNIWGTRYYAQDQADNARTNAVKDVVGNDGDKWDAQKTLYGVVKYVDTTAKDNLIGSSTDASTADTIWGAKNYAAEIQTDLLGKDGDKWSTQKTLYGVVKYVDTTAKDRLIGTSTDTTIDTHYGLKHILIGNTADTTINTHWGVKNSLIGTASDTKDSNTIKGAKKYADVKDGDLEKKLIGTSTDTTINTHHGLKHILIGKSTDAPTADTIWGAKKYAVKTLTGSTGDVATSETIYGVRKYTDEKIKTLSNTAFKVSRIEEGGEGILVFSTVTSYAG